MGNTACSHSNVMLRITQHPDGTRSDYWECSFGCGMKFIPSTLVDIKLDKKTTELDTFYAIRCAEHEKEIKKELRTKVENMLELVHPPTNYNRGRVAVDEEILTLLQEEVKPN